VKVVSAQVNQPTVQVQFAMNETPNDIGAAPYVWFFLGCGSEPESGVVKGKLANGVVTAAIPNPRTQMKPFAPQPSARCDLELRASDSKMADSNSIKNRGRFQVGAPGDAIMSVQRILLSSVLMLAIAAPVLAQEDYTEFASKEDLLHDHVPAAKPVGDRRHVAHGVFVKPAVEGLHGERRHRQARADRGRYTPVERVLVEKATKCPPGAETCIGVGDTGYGYWKKRRARRGHLRDEQADRRQGRQGGRT